MNGRIRFLGFFLILAFVMKTIGESVHEVVGHGIFVLLFGGEIIKVHISLLWPYELSYVRWSGNFETWQLPLIEGGGILVCLVVSFLLQGLLILSIVKDWRFTSPIFWLSFWTFLNPAGYLVMGGIKPFGDVAALIEKGVLTQMSSLLIGFIIFLATFFSISKIFADLLFDLGMIRNIKELRASLCLFWLLIPLTTAMFSFGRGQPLFYVLLGFIPSIITLIASPIPPISLPWSEDCSN